MKVVQHILVSFITLVSIHIFSKATKSIKVIGFAGRAKNIHLIIF